MLNEAETLWAQTIDLIESQDADTKLQIYNSEDYKNAHAAVLYLKNHVKPVLHKVSQGQKLSLTEYNKVASNKKAEEMSHFLCSCFTQSTSITHSPSIGLSVIFAKFKIANIGSG